MIAPVLNWYFRQRYEELMDQAEKALTNQEHLLAYLIENGDLTEYGQKLGFKNIRSYEQFKRQIPVVEYEDLQPLIQRMMAGEANILWPGESTWFAKSSGTTSNASKYIPVTYESLEETHFRGGRDMLTVYCNNNPNTQIFTGKGLFITGSYQANNLNSKSYSGDLSAVLLSHLPSWAHMRSTPDPEIALMDNWEDKIEPMARATMNENVTSITGVPTWVIVLFERLLEVTGKNHIREIWPNLELFFHGGVNFAPYKNQFRQYLGEDMNYLETYNASEGFFGIQFNPGIPDFTLLTHHGIFYEFQPLGGGPESCIPLSEIETETDYALIITTNSGLWRYKIGDTIRFTGKSPYTFRITGRTKLFINAFGEELVIENADLAVAAACEKTGATICDYTASPIYMDGGKGGHEWLIEFNQYPDSLENFSFILDEALKKANGDYEAKRRGDLAMHFPVVKVLPKGIFQAWLRMKGKYGVQNKIPRLNNDRTVADEILAMSSPSRA